MDVAQDQRRQGKQRREELHDLLHEQQVELLQPPKKQSSVNGCNGQIGLSYGL